MNFTKMTCIQWLEDIKNERSTASNNIRHACNNAIRTLKNTTLEVRSVQDLESLRGFGEYIMLRLRDREKREQQARTSVPFSRTSSSSRPTPYSRRKASVQQPMHEIPCSPFGPPPSPPTGASMPQIKKEDTATVVISDEEVNGGDEDIQKAIKLSLLEAQVDDILKDAEEKEIQRVLNRSLHEK